MTYEKIVLLMLEFRVIKEIYNLPHFHGGQWSALFKYSINKYFQNKIEGDKTVVSPISVEHGIAKYNIGDTIRIGLNFPLEYSKDISDILENFNEAHKDFHGHFVPMETIRLENIYSRIGDREWLNNGEQYLSELLINNEIERVNKSQEITIIFYTPFRSLRPEGLKQDKHTYMDEDFFYNNEINPFYHFLQKIRVNNFELNSKQEYKINKVSLQFIDCNYGKGIGEKNFGGVLGGIKISGGFSMEVAKPLVLGQYLGAGKNAGFGFGYYTIEECKDVREIRNIERGLSIFDRTFTIDNMRDAFLELKSNSSPGPDGITYNDLDKSGPKYFNRILEDIKRDSFKFQKWKKGYIPKKSSGYREIEIFNISEKLVMRIISNHLGDSINKILTKYSFAFRKKTNREKAAVSLQKSVIEGYKSGFKADIEDYFNSIDIDNLILLLKGLFPFEKLVDFVSEWLIFMNENGVRGLSQGSVLSPMLSNLYLDRFDREISNLGLRIARFSDDFVILSNDVSIKDEILENVKKILERMNLYLNEKKTEEIIEGSSMTFLGQLIDRDKIEKFKDKSDDISENWKEVFEDRWAEGIPLYLTCLSRGVHCDGGYLVVKGINDSEKIAWSNINRIVIVGRSNFSGATIYRALKENVPLYFIDILGIMRGALYPDCYESYSFSDIQSSFSEDKDGTLVITKSIIESKIRNSMMLLRFFGIENIDGDRYIEMIRNCDNTDSIRGVEGSFARLYFSLFSDLVKPFKFEGRIYHPPDSPVNVLLSFGYTLLYNRIASSLKARGFDNRIGFFHQGRGRHAALASDLMEELRFLIDGMVIRLIRNGIIKEDNFDTKIERYPRLNGEGFRNFIREFENLMLKSVTYDGRKTRFNNYIDEMSEKFRRALKLDIEYIPGKVSVNDFVSIL